MSGKWLSVVIGLGLVAAACSADPTALSVEEYAVALQAVETDFADDSPDPGGPDADQDDYPLGGDLVIADHLYMKFEERLDGWRAIAPPPELSEQHAQLVEALDALQAEVGDYLGQHAVSDDTDFDFGSIGPAVEPFLRNVAAACNELRAALIEAGERVLFADSCNF